MATVTLEAGERAAGLGYSETSDVGTACTHTATSRKYFSVLLVRLNEVQE